MKPRMVWRSVSTTGVIFTHIRNLLHQAPCHRAVVIEDIHHRPEISLPRDIGLRCQEACLSY